VDYDWCLKVIYIKKGIYMPTYENAVAKIQETGRIELADLKKLPLDDLYELVEEIKKWCVYANGNVTKFKKVKDKKKNKKKS
jgi:hypothetical protein